MHEAMQSESELKKNEPLIKDSKEQRNPLLN